MTKILLLFAALSISSFAKAECVSVTHFQIAEKAIAAVTASEDFQSELQKRGMTDDNLKSVTYKLLQVNGGIILGAVEAIFKSKAKDGSEIEFKSGTFVQPFVEGGSECKIHIQIMPKNMAISG